jgi:hypothetical protein
MFKVPICLYEQVPNLNYHLLVNLNSKPFAQLNLQFHLSSLIDLPKHFTMLNLTLRPFIKRLVLRIKGGIVIELILNNILQKLNLGNEDLLVIDKIVENEFNLSYIKSNDLEQYHHHVNLLNGRKFYVSIN